MGRIDKAIKNSIVGIMSFILITIATFVSRKIFATVLGAQYLGLLGLFTDILAMISLSEMGIFAISVFYLYKPLAEDNHKKINTVLNFTKKMYNYIALIVLLIGLVMMCFIDKVAKGTISTGNIKLFFLLSLLNSVASYLLYYKQILIVADQQNFIISTIHALCKLLAIILQITILSIFGNFIIYLVIQICATILENLSCAFIVNRKYPYVKEKSQETLDKETKSDIVKRTKAIFITKLSGFVIYSTDNIIISTFINLAEVGLYSNYILIVSMIKTLFSQIFAAFTTGFGNMLAKEEREQAYIVFKASLFFAFCVSCISAAMSISLAQLFISLWLGKKFLLPFVTVCAIIASLYNNLMDVPAISAQNASALHYKDQKLMFLQIFVNIILSLILVNKFGVLGVVLANLISNLVLPTLSKPYVVYKYIFKKSPIEYYKDYIKYACISLIISIISFLITKRLVVSISFISLIETSIVSLVISCIGIFLLFRKTAEYSYCIRVGQKIIRK